MDSPDRVALAHDYLTQRGGAERVVLSLVRAFPRAPLYTSLYDPEGTFPEFADVEVHTLPVNVIAPLRRHHRLALPLLAPAFSRLRIAPEVEVIVCSSSGWAHAIRSGARKIVYCHTPARWLYQSERYLGTHGTVARVTRAALRTPLERWDRKGALSADRYLANSTWIAHEIARIYGIEAEVLHPPITLDVGAAQEPLTGVEPGYILCVSRLLPYKNVEAVVRAFERLGSERLVVVGAGPQEAHLKALAGTNVRFAGSVGDAKLRWLYQNTRGLVAASYEDFGLTPVEAAAFGKPTAALRFGGFLDTIREGATGLFFEQPTPVEIAGTLQELLGASWDESRLRQHASAFSEEHFIRRIRQISGQHRDESEDSPDLSDVTPHNS